MSKKCVCAAFDSASQLYGQPMFVPSTGVAVRSFTDEVNRQAEGNVINEHPDDFELYLLGFYDDESGLFQDNTPQLLLRGKDAVRLA